MAFVTTKIISSSIKPIFSETEIQMCIAMKKFFVKIYTFYNATLEYFYIKGRQIDEILFLLVRYTGFPLVLLFFLVFSLIYVGTYICIGIV